MNRRQQDSEIPEQCTGHGLTGPCALYTLAVTLRWRYLIPGGLAGLWFVLRRGYTGKVMLDKQLSTLSLYRTQEYAALHAPA